MAQIDKNTVKAENQLKRSQSVRFYGEDCEGLRVLILGNSITRHGPNADIGWAHDWGMAASAEEKDYVHLLMVKILAEQPKATFCVGQISGWERGFKEGSKQLPNYESARAFDADVVIVRCVENCSSKEFDPALFQAEYEMMVDYFTNGGKAKVLLTSSFWEHIADPLIRAIGAKLGAPVVELSDLGEQDEMKAIGLFEHSGVANHPGDAGMAAIAERIFTTLKKEKMI